MKPIDDHTRCRQIDICFSLGGIIGISHVIDEPAVQVQHGTRQYQDKNGNNRTAVEVVANNVNFAGSKSNGSNQGGSSYQNAAPSYQNAAPARPAAVEAAPSYSAGNADDFAVIDDSDDLPF